MSKTQEKAPFKAWIAVGVVFAMGPVWGMVASIMGQMGAYYHLKSTQGTVNVDPAQLAETVSWTLYTALIGWAMFPFGVGIIIYAVRNLKRIDRAG